MADAPASIGQVLESITLNNIVTDNIITNSDVDYFKFRPAADAGLPCSMSISAV